MRSLTGLNNNPVELQVKIAIQWGNYAWSYYGTREENQYKAQIESFGGLQSTVNSDGSANLSDASVTLFDIDQSLQQVITASEAEGSLAIVYLDDQEVFRGQVRDAVWVDQSQTLEFDIVSFIESQELGYIVDENVYTPNNEVVVGKAWPVVFGNPQHVPAIFSQSTPRGKLSRPINLGWNIFNSGYYDSGEEYPLRDDFLDINEAELEAIVGAPIEDGATAVRYQQYLFVPEQDYLKFPGTDEEPEEFKVSVDGVIFRVEKAGEIEDAGWALKIFKSNAAKYEDLACGNRPLADVDYSNPKVLWLTPTDTDKNLVGNYIYINYTKRTYVWDDENKRTRTIETNEWYENICVRQEGLKCWFKYPFFTNRTPGSQPYLRPNEDAVSANIYGLAKSGTTINFVYGASVTGLLVDYQEWLSEMREKLEAIHAPAEPGESRFSGIADQLELIKYVKSAFWSAAEGASVVEWEPEEGDIYIANFFASNEVTGVYARRLIGEKEELVAVPSTYYEIDLSRTANLVDGSTRQVTTIEFSQPLDTYKDQGWDASTVFVTLKSSVVPDGNPADICKYILDNFTNYTTQSFNAVANSLSNNPTDFAYLGVADAFELARQIAWQARSALVSDSGTIRMVNVSLDGSPNFTFTENNTDFQSIKLTQVGLDRLITRNEGKWRKHYAEEDRFTSFSVNQNKFGYLLQNREMFAYNVERLANDALEFWTYRSGISWKIVELSATPASMNLEIYDIVRLNFTDFPNLYADKGVVIGYNYDFTNQKASFTILTSVAAGETTNDSRFWFAGGGSAPTNPANESEIKNYSLVKNNFGLTIEELIREMRKLEDTATIFGKVVDKVGSMLTIEYYPFGPFNEFTRRATAHDVNAHDDVRIGDWVEVKGGQDGVHYIRKAKLPKIFGVVDLENGDAPTSNEYRVRIINFTQPYDVGITQAEGEDPVESNFENHYVGSESPADESEYYYVQARCFNEMSIGTPVGRVKNYTIVELEWATTLENEDGFWYFHTSDVTPKFDGLLGTASTIADNRWAYPFQQVKYTTLGKYTTVEGGVTGTVYNKIEANNTATGIQGCGINVDNLPAGVELVPLGSGAVVEITPVYSCETGEVEYVFEDPNQPDGNCDDL